MDKEKIVTLLKEARTTIFIAESSLKKGINLDKNGLNEILNKAMNSLTVIQTNHLK